jgi:hypothetical protein
VLLNILQSQIAWFACVLFAAAGKPWVGIVIACVLTAAHVLRSSAPRVEALLVLAAGCVGALGDSLSLGAGLITFSSGVVVPGFAPLWMIALWMNFATVLNGPLRALKTRTVLAALIGAVAGPCAYYAGVRLGALHFTDMRLAPVVIGVEWAIALPLLCAIAARLERRGGLSRRATAALVAGFLALLPTGEPRVMAADGPVKREWAFRVLLDGHDIGRHDFRLIEQAGGQEIDSRARFQVKALFIPLYRYEHDDREIWRDGCLVGLEARTNDNGERHSVKGILRDETFSVQRQDGSADLPACVRTFAYWDPDFLRAHQLLNTQTGLYEEVQIEPRGREQIEVLGQSRNAMRHSIRTGKYAIDVWYSPEGEWLQLQTRTPSGRSLRYELIRQ